MVFDPRTSLRELEAPPVLHEGDAQWSVKLLRRLLALFGYGPPAWLDPALPVLAEFDNELGILVGAFQIRCGLDPTGVVDAATWQAFLEQAPPGGTRLVDGRLAIEMRIVEVALAAEARSIREHGANRGATVEMIQRHAGTASAVPWCVAFAWAVVDLAYFLEQELPPQLGQAQKLSSSALVNWAREHARLHEEPAEARPGDLIVLRGGNTGFFHTALTVALPREGFVATVEGNTNEGGSAEGDGIYARRRRVGREHCVFVRL
ncbi:peptidoglycan-binding protein [bacterium]|nr:peptidoglycan-binding protein [bacterium]